VVNHSAMLANKHSIVANPRCYKCEVTSYYLKSSVQTHGRLSFWKNGRDKQTKE
jgi:hypothetical protein